MLRNIQRHSSPNHALKVGVFKVLKSGSTIFITIASLGKMEYRCLTVGDSIEISHLMSNGDLDDREFLLRVLHHQLIAPKQRISDFRKLEDKELRIIVRAFISKEEYAFKYFKDSNNLFRDFKKALWEGQQHHFLRMSKFSPGFQLAKARMTTLDKAIKPLVLNFSGIHEKLGDLMTSNAKLSSKALRSSLEYPRPSMPILLPAVESAKKQLETFNRQFSLVAQQGLDGNKSIIQQALDGLSRINYELPRVNMGATDSFFDSADRLVAWARIVSHELKPRVSFLQDWVKDNSNIFNEIWKSWDEIEKEHRIRDKQASRILRKYKWFICPSMPITATVAILSIAKKKGRKDGEINRLFVEYFSDDNWKILESMVADWHNNPLFRCRMTILTNCVKVMQASDKNKINGAIVVLPTLISQIDGLLTDYLNKHGIPYKVMYDDFVQGGNVKKTGRKSQFRAHTPAVLTDELNELAQDVFLNVLFQSSQRGRPLETPFNFNRHKIMHGESVRFGRKDYVVRAFMVLDFLSCLK